MGAILSYSIVTSVIIAVLYLVYKLAMAGEKQLKLNRAALWAIYGMAFLALPLSGLVALIQTSFAQTVAPVVELGEIAVGIIVDEEAESFDFAGIAIAVYMTGVAVAVIASLLTFIRLLRMVNYADYEAVGKYRLVITDEERTAPFSWWRYIVMSRKDYEESGDMIILHESRHLDCCHWIDLLFAQMVCVLQWYNPASWLMREELKTVHEYQADSAVLAAGANAREYQMLLIKKAVGARFPSLANSLNHSKLKKRITMMYKSKSTASRKMRAIALLPALAVALSVTHFDVVASVLTDISGYSFADESLADSKVNENEAAVQESAEGSAVSDGESDAAAIAAPQPAIAASQPAAAKTTSPKKSVDKEEDKVYNNVESMPEFPDGGTVGLMNYIIANIKYPAEAKEKKIQGRVIVQMVIKKDGSVGDVKVLKGVDPMLDAEAIRVVKSLPAFVPGKMNGKPVSCNFALPISFKLTDDGATITVKQQTSKNPSDYVVYVNGKLYTGSINDLPADNIKSMTFDKDNRVDGKPVIRIELKEKQ